MNEQVNGMVNVKDSDSKWYQSTPCWGCHKLEGKKRRDSLMVSEHPVNRARQFRLVCMRERDNHS